MPTQRSPQRRRASPAMDVSRFAGGNNNSGGTSAAFAACGVSSRDISSPLLPPLRPSVEVFVPKDPLIPPAESRFADSLLVVLDLDETLVYGRKDDIHVRKGLTEFLSVLKDRCEVAVWTAAERSYALQAVALIDINCAIQHCIFRHPLWYRDGMTVSPKDLRLLGRPMDRIILIDNTAEVFIQNPRNSLLVSGFEGSARGAMVECDGTLSILASIFNYVLHCRKRPKVRDILLSKHICRRLVFLDGGRPIVLNTLAKDDHLGVPIPK